MLDNYSVDQKIAYKMLTNSIKKNRESHAYLIESANGSLGFDFAISFAKFLLCPLNKTNNNDCVQCTRCKRIDDRCFSELYIVKSDGLQIKKEQIETLQKEFSLKSVESSLKIYIIDQAEKLNASSSAALLKFLEEPEENIIAILVTTNKNLLLNTILSRCQLISLHKPKQEYKSIEEELFDMLSISQEEKERFFSEMNIETLFQNVLDFLILLEKRKNETIVYVNEKWNRYFKTKEDYIIGFNAMIVILKMCIEQKIKIKEEEIKYKDIVQNNTIKILCEKLDIIISYKEKIKYNLNLNLLIDKFIMDMGKIK